MQTAGAILLGLGLGIPVLSGGIGFGVSYILWGSLVESAIMMGWSSLIALGWTFQWLIITSIPFLIVGTVLKNKHAPGEIYGYEDFTENSTIAGYEDERFMHSFFTSHTF